MTKQHITDQLGGIGGFTVRWEYEPYWTDFFVSEVVTEDDDGVPMYEKCGSTGGQYTTDLADARCFVRGTIKWDSCTHWRFGEEEGPMCGYLHLCGPEHLRAFSELVPYLYKRAFELMGRDPNADGIFGSWEKAPGLPPRKE